MIMQRMRNLREDSDLTQKQMASILSVTQKTYSNYENGTRGISIESLITIASYFGTSVDYLLELTDVKKPYSRAKKYSDMAKKYNDMYHKSKNANN